MKAKLRGTALLLLVALVSFGTAGAQLAVDKNRSWDSPDRQFGFGINDRGLHVQYAIGPAFHVGVNLALDFHKDSAHSETFYDFGPYAKFLMGGSVIKPYAFAALGVVQPNTGLAKYTRNPEGGTGTVEVELPDAELRLYAAIGGEHFFSESVGVYGHVNLLDVMLAGGENDEVVVDGGLLGGTVGVEFFF
jgi:hypothetical protein